jgi:archaeal type IV pilus assembly protein PilA
MNRMALKKTKRAISPIIATLLLILIAIAAGVVVYAYVAGFIGNSTQNQGSTINSISIDYQLLASSATNAKVPVTTYLRNLGPDPENINSGLYLKGTSLSDILGLSATVVSTTTPTITVITINEVSATTFAATVTYSGCANTQTITLTVFGVNSVVTCTGAAGTTAGTTSTSVTTSASVTLSTNPAFTATTGTMSPGTAVSPSASVFGVPITAGYFSIALNVVATLTLCPIISSAGITTNPLVSGNSYTVQITGMDQATTSLSTRSS